MDIITEYSFILNGDFGIINGLLLISAGVSVVFASGFKLYTKLRPRFPARVNCWFCSKDNDVGFSQQESWTCKFCEQYNGFLLDGSYNKIIPAQSDELLNDTVVSVARIPFKSSENGLCRKCNINQELKVQQMASFIPIDDARYDEEIELYRKRLEKAYKLCDQCEVKTEQTLGRIGSWLQEKYGFKNVAKTCTKKVPIWGIVFAALSGIISILMLPVTVLMTVLLFSQYLSILPFRVNAGIRSFLMGCSQWEEKVVLATAVLHLLNATFGNNKFLFEIISALMWGLYMVILHEAASPREVFNLQYLAYTQVCVMSIALCFSLWSSFNLLGKWKMHRKRKIIMKKKAEKNAATLPAGNSSDGNLNIPGVTIAEKTVAPPTPNQKTTDPQEVQDGLGSLSLGPLCPNKSSTPSIFEPRVYNSLSSSDIFNPTTIIENSFTNTWGPKRRKPVISPARLQLSHSSWVSGGYWQQKNSYPTFSSHNSFPFPSAPFSRSSSQTSGFVSQAGTNYSSLPNSRAGSVCDVDRCSVLSEPIYPSYSPPMSHPPSYYYVTTPPAGTTLVIPSHANTTQISSTSSANFTTVDNGQRTFVSVIKENLLLATLFFSSLMFNIIVIALAAVNTFKSH